VFRNARAAHHLSVRANRYLAIYLNDHLAGATLGLELMRRMAKEHDGELGALVARLLPEIEADYRSLQSIMRELGVARSRPKLVAAWTAEKLGRLKPNGHVKQRSPLTPLVELEGTVVGITGKRNLWRALREATDDESLRARLDELEQRAEAQLAELEPHRLEAARASIGT
jgi:hypothetical protein